MATYCLENHWILDVGIAFLGVLISSVLSLVGVIYSSHSTRKTAQESAKTEFEKIALVWKHDAELSTKKAVGEVCAYISFFLWKRNEQSYKDAFIKINEARAITSGPIGAMLDSICYDIEQRRDGSFTINDDDIRKLLAKIIDQCRTES